MKRISLMLALFLTLSFGMAFAQNGGQIWLDHVDGLIGGKIPINAGSATFHFYYENYDPVNKVKGMFNSYEICAPNPITWAATYDNEFPFPVSTNFDLVWGQNVFSWDGTGCDSVVFGGSVMLGPGLPPSYVGPGVWIDIDVTDDITFDGQTMCIDSCYTPPSATWMWAYGSAVGSFPPAWDGPHCYELDWIPDQNVVWTVEHLSYTGDHCVLVDLNYTVDDPDPGDMTNPDDPPAVFQLTGVGNVVSTGNWTCKYTYAPTLANVGASVNITIGAHDQMHAGQWVNTTTDMTFTNVAPAFTTNNGATLDVGMGNTGCLTITGVDNDCDPSSATVVSVSPHDPVGGYTFTDNGNHTWTLCFNTASGAYPVGDGGVTYTFNLEITDGGPDKATSTGTLVFNVLVTEPFEVQIEKTHNTLQGMHTIIDVTLNKGSEDMGGFDFLIAYDASALNFIAAIPGDMHTMCGWEYFNYRYGPFGNCGNQCPSGMLRVVAIAETNNGANHPSCLNLDPKPIVLFSLDFLVSDDRTLECQYVPIRFYWMDCGDNSIAYHPADNHNASIQGVSRYVIDFDLIGHIEDMFTGFPTYTGVQWECLQNDPDKPVPMQFVDFLNGGVDIVCADSIDDRGDINLNGTPNEIADAVLFSNYFVKGIGVFNVNYQGQVAATDVNADGLTLSVADLVYLIRVIVGDALPYPKLVAEAASFAYENGVMSVDTRMGAALVVLEGNVAPRLLADNMEMNYAFDGHNTRVLISKIERGAGFEGEFLAFDANIVSVEMATYEGAPVAAKNVPLSYALHQNYPNPFNPKTTIAFALPYGGDYSLTIYNVTGQKVASFAGSAQAGTVEVDWDAADQASGVYFYKLNTENFTDTKKMVLLK